jgi:large subunit ribosomal protein L24
MIKKQKVRRAVKHPHIRKDDQVIVISGEFKDKTGRVLSVNPEKGTAVVEGLRMIKKHTKPNKNVGKGGIIEKEGPIALSNLCLIDSETKDSKPVKIHTKMLKKEDGKRERVNAKTEKIV